MTYRITGLSPEPFAALFALNDAALTKRNARRVTAAADRGFPCRVSLRDADKGEQLILLHHTSHDVATPYRSAYRSEEHTSELQSLMRISYAVFCLKKKKNQTTQQIN